MALSVGVAYVDVLPNMSKFGPAVAAESAAANSKLGQLAKGGALAVGAIGVASVKMAADFEKSMRNVNSLAGLPEPQFEKLNQQVLNLAGPTAQAPKTLADGLYDLVSSGFDAKEAMGILKASAIAATAGLTTTDVSAKAIAATLNAYKLPAKEATHVSDVLFETVNRGTLNFEELASNVGDVLSVANSIGVPIEGVGAALATMTKQGESAPEASTKLKAAMTALVKPSEEMEGVLKKLGVEGGAELVKKYGSLQEALNAVRGATDGSAEAMNALFPNVRAASGALLLTGGNAKTAAADLDAMNHSAGAAKDVFKEQQKSVAVQFERLKSTLSVLAIEIGSALLPVLNEVTVFLNENLIPAFRTIMSVVGPVFSFLQDKLDLVKQGLTIAFLGPIGLIIVGFQALKGILTVVWNAMKSAAASAFDWLKGAADAVRDWVVGAFQKIKLAGTIVWRVIKGAAAAVWNWLKGAASAVGAVIVGIARRIGATWRAVFNAVKSVVMVVWNAIKAIITNAINGAKWIVNNAINGIKAVIQSVRGVASAVFNAVADAIKVVLGPIETVINAIRDLIGWIGDAISNLGDLIDKASDAVAAQAGVREVNPKTGKPKALGGLVTRGDAYVVGERGRELFVPSMSGRIIPNHKLADVGGAAVTGYAIVNLEEGRVFVAREADRRIAHAAGRAGQRARMGA